MNRLKKTTGLKSIGALATALITAAIFMAAPHHANAKSSIKVTLDSAYIMMGKQTGLNVQVTDHSDNRGEIIINKDSFPKEVELSSRQPSETRSETSGTQLIKARYIIQSFDSGAYRIPPLMYVSGKDTAFSNSVTLKVIPVDVSKLADINPEEGTMETESRWFDWIPDFLTDNWLWIVIGLVIIGGAVCTYLILSKKISVNIIPAKKPEPPYQIAMKKLSALKNEQLWENGQDKEFYTRLTDILREYLELRFGINAMEMTSTQINDALHKNEETRQSNALMKQILEVSDFVKFAKVKPLRDDNIKSFDAAIRFVENTKPAEQTVSGTEGDPKSVKDEEQENPYRIKDKTV